jgi:hypothetical protein
MTQGQEPIDFVPPEKIAFSMIPTSQLINAMLRSYHYQHKRNSNKPTIENVTASEVNYVMKQLKTTGIPLP